jgi:DNA-binding NarL/FixJ family response regulator
MFMQNQRISILLAEDHKIVCKGLRALLELEEDMFVIGEAENGLEAVRLAKEKRPQLIIMDIAMPKLNGIEAAKKILKDQPKTKILVLSAYADDGYIEKMVSNGVHGFLVKQCAPHALIDAIRTIVSGKSYFSPSVNKRIEVLTDEHLNHEGVSIIKNKIMSSRERQVLQLITEGKANKNIAYELGISIKTVEKHRQSLMKKLSIHDVAGLTRYAISEGIIENSIQSKMLSS